MAEQRRAPSAGGVVVADRRVLLLLKRLPPEVRLPKGTIDPGEDAPAAAVREVAEETGFAALRIVAELGCFEVEVRGPGGWLLWPQHYFLMQLDSYRRTPRSARDAKRFAVRWYTFDEALDQISYAAERAVLRAGLEAAGPEP